MLVYNSKEYHDVAARVEFLERTDNVPNSPQRQHELDTKRAMLDSAIVRAVQAQPADDQAREDVIASLRVAGATE